MLSVLTFNIHHGAGLDGRIDLARTADAIRRAAPDLAALQELDAGMPRSGGIDQPAELAALTGLHVVFHATLERAHGGRYGIAVAAREEPRWRYVPLPRLGQEEPRGALVAQAAGVHLVATHLSTRRAVRDVQLAALRSVAEGLEGPVVVAGDLNATVRSLGVLHGAGFRGAPRAIPTLRRGRRRQLDHVLAGPGLRLVEATAVPSEASDHLPLLARVETA